MGSLSPVMNLLIATQTATDPGCFACLLTRSTVSRWLFISSVLHTLCVHVRVWAIRISLVASPGVIIDKLNVHRRINHSSLFNAYCGGFYFIFIIIITVFAPICRQCYTCTRYSIAYTCTSWWSACLLLYTDQKQLLGCSCNCCGQCLRLWKLNCSANTKIHITINETVASSR